MTPSENSTPARCAFRSRMWKITSCLRIVPKFSTPNSFAIAFSSVICIACSLAMFIEAAMRSR